MIPLPAIDWQKKLESIVKQAGKIVCSHLGSPGTIRKKTTYEIVSQADIASEHYLIEQLQQLIPESNIITEESHVSLDPKRLYTWVIDPLDGTTNFVHGLPYFCISVALTIDDIPVVSAVYQPILQEFFFAQQAQGAFLNGKQIFVTHADIQEGLIAFGLPYVHSRSLHLLNAARAIIDTSFAVRHHGAIALDLAYLASGRLDGVLFAHLTWWDVAAGILLVQEAGGMITTFEGNDLTPTYRTCIAGNQKVYPMLKKLLT